MNDYCVTFYVFFLVLHNILTCAFYACRSKLLRRSELWINLYY